MRRFLITSPKFSGAAEIFYNRHGVLCLMDCKQTDMAAETITAFKKAIPATIQLLEQGQSFGPGTTVVERGYRVSFEEFWVRYNKKINKARCIPLYEALSDAETVLSYEAVGAYDTFLEKAKVRQKLDPENWIKNKSWQNEYK